MESVWILPHLRSMRVNLIAILWLYWCVVLTTTQNSDWSMIMEVEVEDPSQSMNRSLDTAQTEETVGLKSHLNSVRCGSLVCYNGARCHQATKAVRPVSCLCPIGFSGEHCEFANEGFRFPRIEDGGYLKFLFPVENRERKPWDRVKEFSISFELSAVSARENCLLVYHPRPLSGTKMLLSIEDNHLVYRIIRKRLPGSVKRALDAIELKHNVPLNRIRTQWYRVKFGHTNQGTLYIAVNEKMQELTTIQLKELFYEHSYGMEEPPSELYFGGYPKLDQLLRYEQLDKLIHRNCAGCIQQIRVQGKLLDPRRKAFVGDAIEGFGITNCAKDVCLKRPCWNNGTCRPASGSTYECLCPFGVVGTTCDTPVTIHLPAYNGHAYTVYKGLQGTSRSQTSLSVTFLPRSPHGLLLYEGLSVDKRGDFVALILSNGHVEAIWDLGSGSASVRSSTKLTLNQWHTVEFWHVGREGFLRLDRSSQIQTAFTVGELVQLTLGQDLYLGGHPDVDYMAASLTARREPQREYNLTGFHGCIQEFILNGIPVRLIEQLLTSANVDNCREHACSSPTSACSNRGRCVPKHSAFHCSCLLGYTGLFCQEKIVLDKTARIAFNGDGYMEISSRQFLTMLNTPHFDIYMDVRVEVNEAISKEVNHTGFVPDRILLGLIDETSSEKRLLILKTNEFNALSLSWIRYNTQSGRISIDLAKNQSRIVPGEPVIDNELYPSCWHKIMLKRSSGDYFLYLNGTQMESMNLDHIGLQGIVFTKLLIGGLSLHLPIVADSRALSTTHLSPMDRKSAGFRGCIGHIHINGRPIIAGDAQSGRNVNACTNEY